MVVCKTKDLKMSSEIFNDALPGKVIHQKEIKQENRYTSIHMEEYTPIQEIDKKRKNLLECKILKELWDSLSGIGTAPDLSIYISEVTPKQIYTILEDLRYRNILLSINETHPDLKEHTDWNMRVYEFNLNYLRS